jgi:hypothetical protein
MDCCYFRRGCWDEESCDLRIDAMRKPKTHGMLHSANRSNETPASCPQVDLGAERGSRRCPFVTVDALVPKV